MAATSPVSVEVSYEEFVRAHADRFTRYLQGVLGRQAEGRGGRVAVEDTLQNALLSIYAQWPQLQEIRDAERDRHLYRCLRDAAGQALRAEHGRRARGGARPRVVSFDFGAAPVAGEDQPAHERELMAAVLGAMVGELAAEQGDREARAMLDRGILVAGLRALTEREAVILIAVDHLGWDQHQLADRLGLGFSALRQTLFGARKIFYNLVRHAVGVEVDEEERARLAAYLAGELTGAEKRQAKRHLAHCKACQELQREQRVFGRDARPVLAPLPFVLGAQVLVKRSSTKAAAVGSGGAGSGLFAQPGAAKAAAVVVGLLGVGVGTSAVLAELQEHHLHVGRDSETPAVHRAPGPVAFKPPVVSRSSAQPTTGAEVISSKSHQSKSAGRQAPSTASATSSPQTSTSSATTPPTTGRVQSPSSSAPKKKSGGGNGEFFAG